MTDRELLELAAKAAEIELEPYKEGRKPHQLIEHESGEGSIPVLWNPLTNDGDAFRLAMKLNMSIAYNTDPDGAFAQVAVPWHEDFLGYWWNEWLHKDAAAATRRAIVRAAAAIGEKT